ncbi:MAG: MoaD/ThiS family protein [Bacillota bacterium]
MSVTVRIPGIWRGLSGGQAEIQVEGATVTEALKHLGEQYPRLRDRLFTPEGELKSYVHIFVNQIDIKTLSGAETSLSEHDEIILLMAIAGGAV